MRFSLSLLVFASSALAQDPNFIQGLAAALKSAGLTQLATVAATVANTTEGGALLNSLQNGTFTVFAPNNDAFKAVPANVSSDAAALTSILSYHVLPGNYTDQTASAPNHTIGRTSLSDSKYVNLEGSNKQVLVWTKQNGKLLILNQGDGSNVKVLDTTSVGGIFLAVIPAVLSPPPSLFDFLSTPAAKNVSTIASILAEVPATPVSTSQSAAPSATAADSIAAALGGAKGFTIFAPSNAGLAQPDIQQALHSLQSNTTALQTVLRNHVINGTTIYSPSLLAPNGASSGMSESNYTSAAGNSLSFMTNSTGLYVTVGNGVATAKIIQSDILLKNGVVHVIDGVLADTSSNEAAASSAFESATSRAAADATGSTQTAPVGQPTSTNSNSGGSNENGAVGSVGLVKNAVSTVVGAMAIGVAMTFA